MHILAKRALGSMLEPIDLGPPRHVKFLEDLSVLYLTPYLRGRRADAFEYFFMADGTPTLSKSVRVAG